MAKQKALTETQVTDQVTRYLELRGWRLVRNQSAFVQRTDGYGQLVSGFRIGEVGMPDWTAIRYLENGVCLLFWLEMKANGFGRTCRCKPAVGKKKPKLCVLCGQKAWRETESMTSRNRAVIVRVSDFQEFVGWYQQRYQWLHQGAQAEGQMELVG